MFKGFQILCFLLFISFWGNAQTVEYVYKSSDPGKSPKVNVVAQAKYDLLYGKDSVVVIVTLLYQTGFEKVKNSSDLKILYDLENLADGTQVLLDTIRTALHPKGKNAMVFGLKFPYMKDMESAELHIESLEWDKTNEIGLTIPVSLQRKTAVTGYQLFSVKSQIPLHSTYCAVKDSLKLLQEGKFHNKLEANFFPASFAKAAEAPYKEAADEKITIQTPEGLFYLDSVFTFDIAGAYTLYLESDVNTPFQIFAGNGKYPQVTKVNDLAGPLVYIANENEWLRLSYNKVTKDTLDHFWLQYTGNKEVARRVIKLYYQRVVQANEYYTEYKEGWKTDRGMVYIVMGRADRISQNGDEETWYYKVGTERVEFKFTRLKNKTKGVYYKLTHEAGLEKAWLETLDKWRRGAIE